MPYLLCIDHEVCSKVQWGFGSVTKIGRKVYLSMNFADVEDVGFRIAALDM